MTTTKFKKVRLFKLAREFNVSVDALVEHITEAGNADALAGAGINASVTTEEAYEDLLNYFEDDKAQAERVSRKRAARKEALEPEDGQTQQPVADEKPAPAKAKEQEDKSEPKAPELPEPEPEPEPEPVTEPEPEPEPIAEKEPEAKPEAKPEAAVEPEPKVSEPAPVEATSAEPVEEESLAKTKAGVKPDEKPSDEYLPSEDSPAAKTPSAQKATRPEEVEKPSPAPVSEEIPELAEVEDEVDEEDDVLPEVLIPESLLSADRYKLAGTKIMGKIDLGAVEDAEPGSKRKRKRKRKRIAGPAAAQDADAAVVESTSKKAKKRKKGPQVDQTDVEQTLQETLRELEQGSSRARQRRRRQRRDERAADREREKAGKAEEETILRITEFLSTGELANLMDVSVTEVISTLFSAGMMVSINQRLDADTITFVTDEFGFDVEFITDMSSLDIDIADDDPADLKPRAPVVTVMGHVDHGKTSLLDFIRSENVVAGEAGGITQHIGAYSVEMSDGKELTFLDTPGHEAFTAMRARGAQVTDVVILVVAADDAVMPQTVEAINHASAAGVPLVVAINKIDKPDVNTDRVMQQLADNNVLVEQWGGKIQCEMVSAMTGQGIPELLDRVLLEAELLDLKANPDRNAICTVIESRLEKGRGTVATVLVQNGTLKVGDAFIAGIYSGRVRAMFDEREHRVEQVGPSRPALVTGLDGAPEVGDSFIVLDDEKEAREIAGHRQQIHREQSLRQRKHITLDEIGRRLALGDFQELKIIVKGDVGGSVEALSDSLLKLGSEEVAVDIIHKGVGAINESDVMLASASDAIIIGFQVRPVLGARQLAEREEIDIRLYSVIYHAIEEVRDALEGLLSPEKSESILGTAEIRETFKTPKAGTVAGCYVLDGKIKRSDRIHLIRDGVVIYEGTLSSLKRFKDDVREVLSGYECGMGIENFNDVKVGDQIEAYEIIEKRRTLDA